MRVQQSAKAKALLILGWNAQDTITRIVNVKMAATLVPINTLLRHVVLAVMGLGRLLTLAA